MIWILIMTLTLPVHGPDYTPDVHVIGFPTLNGCQAYAAEHKDDKYFTFDCKKLNE